MNLQFSPLDVTSSSENEGKIKMKEIERRCNIQDIETERTKGIKNVIVLVLVELFIL